MSKLLLLASAVAILLIAAPANAKIGKYTDNIDPFTFTGTGNNYQYPLNTVFDFSEAKYPITIKADGLGTKPGYTYKDTAQVITGKSGFANLESLFIVNHNNLIISGFKKDPQHTFVDMIQCQSPKTITDFECNVESIKFDKATIGVDHKLEATRFDERAGLYVTAWRNAKTQKLVLYLMAPPKSEVASSNDDPVNFFEFDLKSKKTEAIMINNRARIEVFPAQKVVEDPDDKEKKITVKYTQVYMFDQTTQNGKDKPHSQFLMSAEIYGTLEKKDYKIQEGGNFRMEDSVGLIKAETISTFYEHEGEMFVSSERNGEGYEGLMCLTRVNEPVGDTFTVAPAGFGFFCSDIKGGAFFGMSNGNELFQLMIEENSQELRIFALNDSSKPQIAGTYIKTIKIDTSLKGKTGVREILSGSDAYTMRFAADQGIDDTGANSFTIIKTDDLEDEFLSQKGEVDVIINRIALNVDTAQTNIKILSQPFLFFEDKVLNDGEEVKVDITLNDADNVEVIVKATFTRYDNALAKVKLESYNPVTVELDPNSLTRHYFPYSNIIMGNSLTLEVTHTEGKAINKLVAINHQYQKHFITLPESSTNDRKQFVINSGAAMMVDGMSNTVKYYKCDAENSFSTQCYLSGNVPTHGITYHKHLGATSGVSMTIGEKEIVNSDGNSKTFYYFNWFDYQK